MNWTRFWRRAHWDRERMLELEAHLANETADNIARGMTPEAAAAAARRTLGNPTLIREEIYDMNSIGWIEKLVQDLRHGARLLRLNPGFATVAIASLALGIGANTAIFQLLDAVRLRTLPVHKPHEIVEVRIQGGNGGMANNTQYGQLTRLQWRELRARQQSFAGLFAWTTGAPRIGRPSEARRATSLSVSHEFFPVLGIQPFRGQFFESQDEVATCPSRRVVLGYDYWQRAMGGREPANGDTLLVNGDLHQIIGVTPPGFHGLVVGERFDIVLPLCQQQQVRNDVFDLSAMGRLKADWSTAKANAHLHAISAGVMEASAITGYTETTHEAFRRFKLEVVPAGNGVSQLRRDYDTSLWLLLGITGMVLLIACANLANLMLARAVAREREIAVRLAIGASRGRLIAQLLSESALIAFVGSLLAVPLAGVLSRALVAALSSENNRVTLQIATDWRVFLFAALAAAATCLIFGAAPAIRAVRTAPADAMKCGARGSSDGRERHALQRALVVAQIAVSLTLLTGASLFVRSFYGLVTKDAGVRQDNIGVVFASFPALQLPRERITAFKQDLVNEVRALPGIANASSSTHVPLLGRGWAHGVKAGSADVSTPFAWVSPSYFDTMGVSILAGRGFNDSDTRTSQRVAVVNQAFGRVFYPGEANLLGKTLMSYAEPGYPETVFEIVGVMTDAQVTLKDAARPSVLVPASQHPDEQPGMGILIRSHVSPESAIETVRRHLAAKHPEMMLDSFPLRRRVHDGLLRERLMAMLSGFFGVLAALLTTLGLYGVIDYVLQRRRHEVGVRLALGAKPSQVVTMVLREAGLLLSVGLVVGAVLAVSAGQIAASLLFGLKPHDPMTLIAAALLLAAIAIGASVLPARRASKLDPMAALRHE